VWHDFTLQAGLLGAARGPPIDTTVTAGSARRLPAVVVVVVVFMAGRGNRHAVRCPPDRGIASPPWPACT
jgi:hypothetical protein